MKKFLKGFEKYELVKIIGIIALLAIVITWIIPYGEFSETTLNAETFTKVGIMDLGTLLYYSVYFSIDKIIFLLVLGGFYGLLNSLSAYKRLVSDIAVKLKGKEIGFVLIVSLIIAVFTSILTQTFAVLVFVPFIINIILNMKLDKMTAFITTFGAMLVGIVGATYGTEALYYFNYYYGTTIQTSLLLRLGLLALTYLIFSFFNIMHVKKILKNKNVDDRNEELLPIDEITEVGKNEKKYPLVIALVFLGIVILLGYFNWVDNFAGVENINNGEGIKVFSEFFTNLQAYEITTAFSYKLIYLLLVGLLYIIVGFTNSYKSLIKGIANKLKGKELLFITISTLVISSVAFFYHLVIGLVLIPFIIAIVKEMKFDKTTAIISVIGAMVLSLFGRFILFQFDTSKISKYVLYIKIAIFVVGYVLFTFFNSKHLKNVLKNNKNIKTLTIEKKKVFPIVNVMFALLVMGGYYLLVTLINKIPSDATNITIFSDLLGKNIAAFGDVAGGFNLYTLCSILMVSSIVIAFVSKIKVSEYISGSCEGIKKSIKLAGIFICIYFVFAIAYNSQFIPVITNKIIGLSESFNPFLTALSAFITSIFHVDMGYTAYLVGAFLSGTFANYKDIIFVIYTTVFGFVQFISPTSIILVIGLTYLKISYKDYMKYIWKFAVGIFACLALIYALLTYL